MYSQRLQSPSPPRLGEADISRRPTQRYGASGKINPLATCIRGGGGVYAVGSFTDARRDYVVDSEEGMRLNLIGVSVKAIKRFFAVDLDAELAPLLV